VDIPAEVWSALIGLLGGVIGVSIGVFLQRGFERQHCERTIRLDAYDEFLTVLDEFLQTMQEKPVDVGKARIARENAQQHLTRVMLVGSEDAINAARRAVLNLTMLWYVASALAIKGVPAKFSIDDPQVKKAYDARWTFIVASRKDIKATPAEVPRPSVLPVTTESEEMEHESGEGPA
jgi:hypothetical protein